MLICFYINKYFINRFKTTTKKLKKKHVRKSVSIDFGPDAIDFESDANRWHLVAIQLFFLPFSFIAWRVQYGLLIFIELS